MWNDWICLKGCCAGYGQLPMVSSLFGLLEPLEFIFSVDNSDLWQRHVSWAKPNGQELRQYYTQRYAATLGFLSFMLSGEIVVFFNSSKRMTEMRDDLEGANYSSLLYWIAIVMLLDIVVTVVGVVSTFTVWGMVLAISDKNSHCLLRSSIGLYVIGLPPRYVVAALYLYLLWIMLWMVYLIAGPVQYLSMVLVTLFLFFQVIAPLSAFGRLIIYTGAMSQKPVIEETVEKQLLPSGLHAALLIVATQRQRRNTAVTEQYKRQKSHLSKDDTTTSHPDDHHTDPDDDDDHFDEETTTTTNTVIVPTPKFPNNSAKKTTKKKASFSESSIFSADSRYDAQNNPVVIPNRREGSSGKSRSRKKASPKTQSSGGGASSSAAHNRTLSVGFNLPDASILNSAITKDDLQELVITILPPSQNNQDEDDEEDEDDYAADASEEENQQQPLLMPPPPLLNNQSSIDSDQLPPPPPRNPSSSQSKQHKTSRPPPPPPSPKPPPSRPPRIPRGHHHHHKPKKHHRIKSSQHAFAEWATSNEIRDLYGESPAPDLPDEITLDAAASVSTTNSHQFSDPYYASPSMRTFRKQFSKTPPSITRARKVWDDTWKMISPRGTTNTVSLGVLGAGGNTTPTANNTTGADDFPLDLPLTDHAGRVRTNSNSSEKANRSKNNHNNNATTAAATDYFSNHLKSINQTIDAESLSLPYRSGEALVNNNNNELSALLPNNSQKTSTTTTKQYDNTSYYTQP